MDGEEDTGEEAVLHRQQRKEKKDLQAKIQSMKNAVPKNDKKRRKQLTEDITRMESEMEEKHKQELQLLSQNQVKTEDEGIVNGVNSLDLGSELPVQQQRISKAQKRREKKAVLEKERDERIAEAEIENLSGARHLEGQKLAGILGERELQIKQIPSDGHCMYRAIEHQLRERDNGFSLANLRSQTADYMQIHVDEFLPFLTNSSTGEMYSQEEFEKYCTDIANTASWGGQLELRALSHVLKTPIEVIQADSPPIIIGEEYSSKPITLIYMRHAYGLGEHYNSVEPLKVTSSDS
ncbi:deubiquitinase OTUD6B [Bombina bombina]|uniref:deubiquitinase OTUD6B n=1 Tax=Bombina bombina TaxID=8345 RepID=UPI00235AA7C8|nr:deubiquitinase OTUD6B [Bombina bombina]